MKKLSFIMRRSLTLMEAFRSYLYRWREMKDWWLIYPTCFIIVGSWVSPIAGKPTLSSIAGDWGLWLTPDVTQCVSSLHFTYSVWTWANSIQTCSMEKICFFFFKQIRIKCNFLVVAKSMTLQHFLCIGHMANSRCICHTEIAFPPKYRDVK